MSKHNPMTSVVLGSGDVYLVPITSEKSIETILADLDANCTEGNMLAEITGGAVLKYSIEQNTVTSDSGRVSKTCVSSESATMSTNLFTFAGPTFAKIIKNCKSTEDTSKGIRTVKLGGSGNASAKDYVLIFKHADPDDGNLWVAIHTTGISGDLELSFTTDDATTIAAEFTALSGLDKDGTLIVIQEEIDAA